MTTLEIMMAATNNLNLRVLGKGVGIPWARESLRVRYHKVAATMEKTRFPTVCITMPASCCSVRCGIWGLPWYGLNLWWKCHLVQPGKLLRRRWLGRSGIGRRTTRKWWCSELASATSWLFRRFEHYTSENDDARFKHTEFPWSSIIRQRKMQAKGWGKQFVWESRDLT